MFRHVLYIIMVCKFEDAVYCHGVERFILESMYMAFQRSILINHDAERCRWPIHKLIKGVYSSFATLLCITYMLTLNELGMIEKLEC
jgi:hypothetical protein